jgi:hypothetical protein
MERTIRTIATVSFDKMSNLPIPDGRQTMRQDIESIRADNTDRYAPYGEFADNSVCWGRATLAGKNIQPNKSDMFDNGSFDNEDRFKRAFMKYKDETDIRYNSPEPKIGKYNYGLTNSCILLGDDAYLIHHFGNGKYKKTKFSVEKAIRENTITENICDASLDEIEQFLRYQYMLDPLYDQKTGRGTHLRIENLVRKNTPETFSQLCRFMYGLYSPECHQRTTFKLYNSVHSSVNPNTLDEYTIAPNDLSFGAKPCETNTVYVYRDEKDEDKNIYTKKQITNKDELYHFGVKVYVFDETQATAEKEIFGNKTHTEQVGFKVKRAGRLVTGIFPKLWVLSTGAMRGKGIRIHIDIPANEEADRDWCIGTFKKITDDTWIHFNTCLQNFIREEFKDNSLRLEQDIKRKQTDFVKEYEEKTKKVKELTSEEETKNILKEVNKKLITELDNKDGVIQRKSGNAYRAIQKYINALDQHAKTFAPIAPTPIVAKNDIEPKIVVVSVAKQMEQFKQPLGNTKETKSVVPVPVVPVPVVPVPVVPVPVVPVPVVPVPVVPVPVVPAPVIQSLLVPKPSVPVVPVIPAPVIPAPVVPAPKKELSYEEWLKKVGGSEVYLKTRYNIEKNL